MSELVRVAQKEKKKKTKKKEKGKKKARGKSQLVVAPACRLTCSSFPLWYLPNTRTPTHARTHARTYAYTHTEQRGVSISTRREKRKRKAKAKAERGKESRRKARTHRNDPRSPTILSKHYADGVSLSLLFPHPYGQSPLTHAHLLLHLHPFRTPLLTETAAPSVSPASPVSLTLPPLHPLASGYIESTFGLSPFFRTLAYGAAVRCGVPPPEAFLSLSPRC